MPELNLFELGVEKYFSFPKTYTPERQRNKLEEMILSKNFLFSEKTDGNWARFVLQEGTAELQTRGASKKTGKSHGEIQDKVLFFEDMLKTFTGDTVLLGEVYLDNGIDSDVGAILRCLPEKAIARQKEKRLKYRIFDVLYLDGTSLLQIPIESRHTMIDTIIQRINNPLVSGVKYYPMNDTFYDKLEEIFTQGGEGVVAIRKDHTPILNMKSAKAWVTLKIKKELEQEADVFIIGIEEPERLYNGKYLEDWKLWQDVRTGEKLEGLYFDEYGKGLRILEPISKNYFHNFPGAILCGVYDSHGEVYPICRCAGLTDEMRASLRDNYEMWNLMPIKLSAMQVSQNDHGEWSLRHPRLISVRTEDISIEDCTLSKIID